MQASVPSSQGYTPLFQGAQHPSYDCQASVAQLTDGANHITESYAARIFFFTRMNVANIAPPKSKNVGGSGVVVTSVQVPGVPRLEPTPTIAKLLPSCVKEMYSSPTSPLLIPNNET
jgi:hypothetical protein